MINNTILTRKEREREFRRNEILAAAVKFFAQKGFEQTTLDEIADAAEFGKGTLYNYFQNKEEIYTAILERIFSDYFKLIEDCNKSSEDLKDFITRLTRSLFTYCLENKFSFLLLVRTRTPVNGDNTFGASEKIRVELEKMKGLYRVNITEAIKKKEIKDLDVDSVIILYRSIIFPYIYNLMFCDGKHEIDMEKEINIILTVFFDGILNKS